MASGIAGVADRGVDWLRGQGRLGRSLVRWGTLPYHILRRDRRPGVIVLLYHRVGGHTRSEIDMTAGAFERQMRFVRQHYRVVSLDELVALNAQGGIRDASRNLLAVTFDDAFIETYTVVFPILRRYGVPATVYAPAMYVEERRPMDFGAFRSMDPARRPMAMTWDQAAEMVRSGLVTIGGHTNTHADFSRTPVAEARRELDDCDRLIGSRLGMPPQHFAYPWGRWSPDTHALVASRYKSVTLGGPGRNPYAGFDPSRLWRYPVIQSDGFWLFRARLASLPARPFAPLPQWTALGARAAETDITSQGASPR